MAINDLIEELNLFEVNKLVTIDFTSPKLRVPLELVLISREITNGISEPKVKAYAIYNWIEENISYNELTNENFNEKSAIVYTLKKKAGTCYSMTHLYVTMAKSVGLDARITKVIVDRDGKRIKSPGHICAMVNFTTKNLLFDPAYHDGDAKHKEVTYFSREDTNNMLIDDLLMPYKAVLEMFGEKKDYSGQLECCEMALQISPENNYFEVNKQKVLNLVGIKNVEKGYFENAVACFNEILKIDPYNSYAKKNLKLAKSMATEMRR